MAPMPPPLLKGEDPERHYRVAAAAYAVFATDQGHQVKSVERDLVICPRPDMERLAQKMRVTFQNKGWQRIVQRETIVDLACHVDEHGKVRVAKPPPRAWHANPWVNRHIGMLIGLDRDEVLERLTAKTERLVARRWKAIEAIADHLSARRILKGVEVRRILRLGGTRSSSRQR